MYFTPVGIYIFLYKTFQDEFYSIYFSHNAFYFIYRSA